MESVTSQDSTNEQINQLKSRKKAFCFNTGSDIELLKEVFVAEPYQGCHGDVSRRWDHVAETVAKYSAETARKRFATILAQFKSDNAEQIKLSRTEEEYDERSLLLQDILERMDNRKLDKATKKTKAAHDKEKASKIKDAAMQTLQPKDTSPNHPSTSSFMSTVSPVQEVRKKRIRGKDDRLMDIMEEELRLKSRQQDLESDRLKLDEEKWRLKKEEKMALMDLLKIKLA